MIAQVDRAYFKAAGPSAAQRFISYALFEGRPATTRGQFVNPAVFAYLKRIARRPPSSAPFKPIFILGVGRSGTTHIGRLLSVHPQTGFLNEPKALWHVIDPAEDVSGFYNRGSGRFVLDGSDVNPIAQQRAWSLYAHYARVVRAQRVVDKYPELTYRAQYLRALFPEAVLIAIVRDPGAVMGSIEAWNTRNSRGEENWWGVADSKWVQLWDQLAADDPVLSSAFPAGRSIQDDTQRALIEWVVGMRAIVDSPETGRPDLVIRYESLVANAKETVAQVLSACDLSLDQKTLAFADHETQDSTRSYPDADFGALTDEVARLKSALGYDT